MSTILILSLKFLSKLILIVSLLVFCQCLMARLVTIGVLGQEVWRLTVEVKVTFMEKKKTDKKYEFSVFTEK